MKLQAYILNGKPLTEYSSWSSGDVNGIEFIVDNIIQTNYQDVSSITNWDNYGSRLYISYKLSPINSSDLAKSTSELCNDYINYNIITKVKDGISGLFDYLRGEGDYINNGYPSKSYWLQQDQNKLMDILENGNY